MLELFEDERPFDVRVEDMHVEDFIAFDANLLQCFDDFFFNVERRKAEIFEGFRELLGFFVLWTPVALHPHELRALVSLERHDAEIRRGLLVFDWRQLQVFRIQIVFVRINVFHVLVENDLVHRAAVVAVHLDDQLRGFHVLQQFRLREALESLLLFRVQFTQILQWHIIDVVVVSKSVNHIHTNGHFLRERIIASNRISDQLDEQFDYLT